MKNPTIHERREKDVLTLANIMQDETKARRFFNSFYRLAGLESRLCMLENNERTYERNKKYIERESERGYKWLLRLNKTASEYGLKVISQNGYLSLYHKEKENGALGNALTYGHYY